MHFDLRFDTKIIANRKIFIFFNLQVYPKLGIQIQKSVEKYNIEIPQLKTVHSVITIKAVPDIFKNGKLKLRCLATMFTLYRRTEELEVLEDAPLLALIMVPTTQSSEGKTLS